MIYEIILVNENKEKRSRHLIVCKQVPNPYTNIIERFVYKIDAPIINHNGIAWIFGCESINNNVLP